MAPEHAEPKTGEPPDERPLDEQPPDEQPPDAPDAEAGSSAFGEPADREELAPAAAPAKRRRTKAQQRELKVRRRAAKKARAAAKRPAKRKPIVRLSKPERERRRPRERTGVVVSAAADKTIVVRVELVLPHPRYGKVVRRSRKLHAHDTRNAAGVGDRVRIVETRPMSKLKSWRLAEVIEVAK